MRTVKMLEPKSTLSHLVEAVESGQESETVIARNSKPAARLVPMPAKPSGSRIGGSKGLFVGPDPDPELDAEVAALSLNSDT